MSETQLAIYAGSFDPPTFGHLDLVERASKLFPQVIVAIGINRTRAALFTVEQRLSLMQQICVPYSNVRVESFEGLLVDYGKRVGARVVVRGLRAGTDFEYELQIAHANADLRPGNRHRVPADAYQLRLHQRVFGARDRQSWRRRQPLRTRDGLHGAARQVRLR